MARGILSPFQDEFCKAGGALAVGASPFSIADSRAFGTFGFVEFCLDLLRSDGYKNGYSFLLAREILILPLFHSLIKQSVLLRQVGNLRDA